jgi:endonuclease/exonuclease/phosphatase family metal-dependent hydrolase
MFLMKKILYFLFPVLLSANSTVAQSDTLSLTFISYNIYHGENPYNPGNSNIMDIAGVLNQLNPDLVALQEVDSMTVRTARFNNGIRKDLMLELGKLTGLHHYFAKAIDYSEGGYGEGILSKHNAIFEMYALPIPNGGEIRSMALAHIKFENGQKISFAATHLCHQFEENRLAQTRRIIEVLTSIPNPVILAGDFNFTPGSKEYELFEKGFNDLAVEFENPAPTYSSKKPEDRIDFIWLSKKSQYILSDYSVINIDYSDHLPVLAKIRLVIRKQNGL